MLRIYCLGLARGDGEELRIELLGLPAGEEPALTVADRPGHGVIVGVVGIGVPTFGGNANYSTAAIFEQFPVLLGAVHPAGETASDANHSDRFGARLLGDLQTRGQIVDFA